MIVEVRHRSNSQDAEYIKLSEPEERVLSLLSRRKGKVVSISTLQLEAWKGKTISRSSVSVAIAKLRRGFAKVSERVDEDVIVTAKNEQNETGYMVGEVWQFEFEKNIDRVKLESTNQSTHQSKIRDSFTLVALVIFFVISYIWLDEFFDGSDKKFFKAEFPTRSFLVDSLVIDNLLNYLSESDYSIVKEIKPKQFFKGNSKKTIIIINYNSGYYMVDCIKDSVTSVVSDEFKQVEKLLLSSECSGQHL